PTRDALQLLNVDFGVVRQRIEIPGQARGSRGPPSGEPCVALLCLDPTISLADPRRHFVRRTQDEAVRQSLVSKRPPAALCPSYLPGSRPDLPCGDPASHEV